MKYPNSDINICRSYKHLIQLGNHTRGPNHLFFQLSLLLLKSANHCLISEVLFFAPTITVECQKKMCIDKQTIIIQKEKNIYN